MAEPYWKPHEIHYDRQQVDWLLPHLKELREGIYPADPRGTGYTEIPGSSIRARASYECACLIAAEIDIRLAHCGLDKYLVEAHFVQGLEIENISGMYFMSQETVMRRIESSISYISSGRCQRWVSCETCLSKCKKEGRRPITYHEWTGHRRNYRNAKL